MKLELKSENYVETFFLDNQEIDFRDNTVWHNIIDRLEYYLLNQVDLLDRVDFIELFINKYYTSSFSSTQNQNYSKTLNI